MGQVNLSTQLNQHLGRKLRLRRTSLGLTQTQVAKAINVTFQQIQKYEKGTNGVSSARLLQLANFLKVPIKYFFEDYQDFQVHNQKDTAASLNYTFLLSYSAIWIHLKKRKYMMSSKIIEILKKLFEMAPRAGLEPATKRYQPLALPTELWGIIIRIQNFVYKTIDFFSGGHAQNRTGIKGFAILCVPFRHVAIIRNIVLNI